MKLLSDFSANLKYLAVDPDYLGADRPPATSAFKE